MFLITSLISLLSELNYFRTALRTFCVGVRDHQAGAQHFDVLKYNMKAMCLITYFVSALGRTIKYDDDEAVGSIGDEFMLGDDLQFLFRYCLTIHLSGLKDKG